MGKPFLALILFLIPLGHAVGQLPAPPSQLVVTYNAACLLGFDPQTPAQPVIECRVISGPQSGGNTGISFSELFRVPAQFPLGMTGMLDELCLLDANPPREGIHCYPLIYRNLEDVEDDSYRRGLAHARVLAADTWGELEKTLCEADADGQIACQNRDASGFGLPSPGLVQPPQSARASRVRPGSLAVSGLVGCAITDAGDIGCWPLNPALQGCADVLNDSRPRDLRNPADLLLQVDLRVAPLGGSGRCEACVLDTDRVVCWGNQDDRTRDDREFRVTGLRQLPDLPPAVSIPLFSAEQDSYSIGMYPYLRTDGQAARWPDYGTLLHAGSLWDFPAPAVAPSSEASLLYGDGRYVSCQADAQFLECRNHYGEGTVRVEHHLLLNALGLESLSGGLKEISSAVYLDKKPVLEKAAELARSWEGEAETRDLGRLFLADAVAPVVESDASDFFQQQVIPSFQALRRQAEARYGIRALRDFPGPIGVLSALSLLQATLPWLRTLPVTGFAAFETNLGVALAKEGDAGSLAALADSSRALRAVLTGQAVPATDGGLATAVLQLLDYLAPTPR
jgi:hypothetical protein